MFRSNDSGHPCIGPVSRRNTSIHHACWRFFGRRAFSNWGNSLKILTCLKLLSWISVKLSSSLSVSINLITWFPPCINMNYIDFQMLNLLCNAGINPIWLRCIMLFIWVICWISFAKTQRTLMFMAGNLLAFLFCNVFCLVWGSEQCWPHRWSRKIFFPLISWERLCRIGVISSLNIYS